MFKNLLVFSFVSMFSLAQSGTVSELREYRQELQNLTDNPNLTDNTDEIHQVANQIESLLYRYPGITPESVWINGQLYWAYKLPLGQPSITPVQAPVQNLRNLIVNYIPNELGIGELTQIFAQFGEIVEVRIIYDRFTGRSKGYGFVKFKNKEDAARAQAGLNGFEVYGKRLKVSPAQGPSRTF